MRRSRQELANLRRSASFGAPKTAARANFSSEAAAKLQQEMLGTVVLASSEEYDQARHEFLSQVHSSPQIVTYCEVARDVQLCLKFAVDHGLLPVCRSGGHSTAGYSVNNQMIIDVSRMSYAVVDKANRTAVVGAGTNFGKLDTILNSHGLHVPGGGCAGVGVAGYMQGGGYGFTSLMYGMNCDCVSEVVVALANQQVVTANAEENSDLFWAIRGGTGNNFGVLLEITYQLHELAQAWGFGLRWPLDSDADLRQASKVLETWQALYTGPAAGDRLGHEGIITYVEGDPVLLIRGMYGGPADQCEKALEPLLELCSDPARQREIWRSGSYQEINTLLLGYPAEIPDVPLNVRAAVDSRIVARQLDADDWRTVLDFFMSTPNTANTIGLEPYGGAINKPAPEDTAFYHRRAMMDVFFWSFWMFDEEEAGATNALGEFRRTLDPLGNGHSYQNYPNRVTVDYATRYWGENYPRLRAVKTKYDPDTLFQFPQMIQPLADDAP